MRVVVDTNVLVSGLLSPFQPPGRIVQMISAGAIQLLYDARILSEYQVVLARPKFSFDLIAVKALLDQIQVRGVPVACIPFHGLLKDETDRPFIEVAIAGSASFLITGNEKHFPKSVGKTLRVVSPRAFIDPNLVSPR